jgi:hypothetical protein
VAVGDFNGDGNADLIIEDENIDASRLLLGNGDGTFALVPGFPAFLAVGDFNGDGWTDLVGDGAVLFAVGETSTARTTAIAVPVATGTQQVEGSYAGDNTYQPSVSSTISLIAPQGTPTISLTASPNPATVGAPVTLTATITFSGPHIPTGTVSFYAGSSDLGAATLNSGGIATFTANGLTAGQYSLTASYEGNADYSSATSPAVALSVAGSPVSTINSMSPAFTNAGGTAFTLTITGTGFVSGSTVYWGTTALSTQFVSATQLSAQVATADISSAGATAITVQTPAPGGGTSNSLQFEVDSAGSGSTPPTFGSSTATVAAGSTASYPVTLPSTATSVSVTCLNLPSGATCSYSAATNTVTITTTSTTPAGTYQVIAVFTETLPGAAAGFVLLPILLLPLVTIRRKWTAGDAWLMASLGFVLLIAAVGCGGGGSSSIGGGNQTHQVTSSGVVSLTVQ